MILLTALLLQVAGAQPATGDALLAKMHDHWSGKWSTSRTFVQRTVVPNRPDQTWFESEAAGFLDAVHERCIAVRPTCPTVVLPSFFHQCSVPRNSREISPALCRIGTRHLLLFS